MKLASYKDGSRDGQLVVVSRDLSTAHYATGVANKMQQVMDDWNFFAPQLQDLYDTLNRSGDLTSSASKARHSFPFEPQQCMAPLPRAYQRVACVAYRSQLEDPGEPLLQYAVSNDLLGPCDDVPCSSEALGIDFGAELAVITGDVGIGATPTQALEGIRLLMLGNVLSFRQFKTPQQGAAAFSPVAVTLDELGAVWDKGRLHLTMQTSWNGRLVGSCDAGAQMTFHFGQLLAQLCNNRNLRAGTIVGSGPVSNTDASLGFCCIAEKRAIETNQDGKPATEFMKFGDTLRIEMKDRDGQSLFGAIQQRIVPLGNVAAKRKTGFDVRDDETRVTNCIQPVNQQP
jgi:fumarylacetoacetate (FAA) hydrolase